MLSYDASWRAATFRRIENRWRDWRLGIATCGTAPAESLDHVYYATVSYSCTEPVLQKLVLRETDTFVDVGCGKGRVVCLAAMKNVGQVVGIEYSRTLVNIARQNIDRLRGRKSAVKIISERAESADYSEATVLYFFNPFEPSLLESVLLKIRSDRQRRAIRMAFVMESQAQKDVFALQEWLTCYDRFQDKDGHQVAFYRQSDAFDRTEL